MTNELKEVISKIDKAFVDYFSDDSSIKTIFVAGSMAHDDYIDRQDNDYDIRAISSHVTREQIINFEKFLENLSNELTTDEIAVGYSCLVGPVNHKVATDKKNVLIHAMIHQSDQMDDFLPVTHKYQYGTRYRIVYGEDSLKRFQDVRFGLDDVLDAHEGLRYCIDMLKKREYRYLTWDVTNKDCQFNFHVDNMPMNTIIENCCYSFNKFLSNLRNYCNWNDYDIPSGNMSFALKLLGKDNCSINRLNLLYGLLNKNDKYLENIFNDPCKNTIELLEICENRVLDLDIIFTKLYNKENNSNIKVLSKK